LPLLVIAFQQFLLKASFRLGLGFLEQKYLRVLVDGPRRVHVIASAIQRRLFSSIAACETAFFTASSILVWEDPTSSIIL